MAGLALLLEPLPIAWRESVKAVLDKAGAKCATDVACLLSCEADAVQVIDELQMDAQVIPFLIETWERAKSPGRALLSLQVRFMDTSPVQPKVHVSSCSSATVLPLVQKGPQVNFLENHCFGAIQTFGATASSPSHFWILGRGRALCKTGPGCRMGRCPH